MKAYELIEKGWTQGADARNTNGDSVSPHSPEAVCYCVHGALYRAYDDFNEAYDKSMNLIMELPDRMSIVLWNDAPERTQAEVVDLLKKLDI